MDSKIRKSVRTAIDSLVTQLLPKFERVSCDDLNPGERVYRSQPQSDVSYFLFLLESPKQNEFTLEGAIAHSGEFPAYCGLMNPREVTMPDGTVHRADRMSRGQFRARAGTFREVYEDMWWSVDAASVGSACEDAVVFFKETMLPCLTSLAGDA